MAGVPATFIAVTHKGKPHMDSQASLLRQLSNKNLNANERAELCCQLAKRYEETGHHEAARQVMAELWQGIGERPNVEGLELRTAAEVLLRVGVLTGCQQIEGAQETARNLITESLTIFQSFKHGKKIAEAQAELARCYFKEGRYDEARIILQDALKRLHTDSELKAVVILRSAVVEWGAARYTDALRILQEATPLFEKINSYSVRGSYHNQLAMIYQTLAEAGQLEYLDKAFIEYTAASFHFEEANHKRYLANVENNLGLLYFTANKFKEAHRHLDYARLLMASLKNREGAAQVDETRARVFLAEGRNKEAEKAAQSAVRVLERNEHYALAEALITHGRAQARLGRTDHARITFYRALEISEQSGALARAGEAAICIVREVGGRLEEVQDLSEKLPLVKELRRYEHGMVKEALIKAHGSVTQAARLLRTSHQHLAYLLEHRHKDLLALRTPAKRRQKPKR